MDKLLVALRQLRWRLSIQQWIRFVAAASFISSTTACVWLFLTKLFPMLGDPVPVFFGMFALGVAAATVMAVLRRPGLVRTALETDDRLALDERLTSSYELADAEGAMVEALHRDARAYLDRLNMRKAFPYGVPRHARWLVVPLLAFGLAHMLMPELDLLGHREREAEAYAREQAVRVRAEKLRKAVRPLEKLSGENVADLLEAATSVERIAESMESREINEKQALAKLTNLANELMKQREQLQESTPVPKLAGDMSKLGMTREMANDIQNGRFGDAAQKAKELAEKMKKGGIDEKKSKRLADELKTLSEMLGGKESQVGQALADAASSLATGDLESALQAMNAMELSLEDLASVLEQLEMLNLALGDLARWRQDMLGPSEFCRICGMPLKPCDISHCPGGCCGPGCSCFGMCKRCYAGIGGMWAEGLGGIGGGMGARGRGRGGLTGELPEVSPAFKPTVAPGPLTKGKVLADILQKSAPDEDVETTLDYVSGAFIQVRQEAEQALTKEQIPPGSKEFVRQYFGSLEPEDRAQLRDNGS